MFVKPMRPDAQRIFRALGKRADAYDNVHTLVTHALAPGRGGGPCPRNWRQFKAELKGAGVMLPRLKRVQRPATKARKPVQGLSMKPGQWLKY